MGVVVVVVSATSISLEAVFITFQRRMAALRVEESMMNKVLKVDGLAVLFGIELANESYYWILTTNARLTDKRCVRNGTPKGLRIIGCRNLSRNQMVPKEGCVLLAFKQPQTCLI
jgi:hypothetical protein